MLKYLTGAAAIALAASAVSADPGGGKGGGGGGGGGNPQAQGGGGGGEKSHGNGGGKAHQGQGGGGDKGADHALQSGNGNGNSGGKQQARAASRGPDNRGPDKAAKPERGTGRAAMADERGRDDRAGNRGEGGPTYAAPRNSANDRDKRDGSSGWRWADSVPQRTRGLIAGCPPGLAKKNNGCLPPGLARRAAAPVFYDSPNWWNFDDRWHDSAGWNGGDTRYYDGYLVRYGDRGIDSWLPLLGGALSPGNLWPSQYETQGLPSYYQDYYGVGEPDGYRYYDDTLYRVDPQSQAITAISALLTGNSFQVGQQLPQGYDVYNVPSSYRDRYRDGPDADYRYSDGSIYQVDPKTQLVQAVIGLLT